MKKLFYPILLLVNLFYSIPLSAQMIVEKEKTVLAINWDNYLGKQDIIWETLPTDWREGAFMGNGQLSVLLFKDPLSNNIILHTGSTVTNPNEPAMKRIMSPGAFRLEPNGRIIKGTMRLNLWNAETTVDIKTSKGSIQLSSFVHADEMIIVNRITTTGSEDLFKWTWTPASYDKRDSTISRTVLMPEGGKSIISTKRNNKTTVLWYDQDKNNKRTLYITINHSDKDTLATETGKEVFRNQLRKGYARTVAAHRNWWHDYYSASFLSLPDAKLENFYWIQLYKLGSMTRPENSLINISEMWRINPDSTTWAPRVLLPYWVLNGSNHTDLTYQVENIDGNPTGYKVKRPFLEFFLNKSSSVLPASNAQKMNWKTSELAWICYNLWQNYRYKMDDQTLEQLYPILKQTTNNYLQKIQKDSLGVYHLSAVYLPNYGLVTDYNYDLALLKWGCHTLISIANRLQINDPQIIRWRHILKNLAPIATDKNEILIGKDTPIKKSTESYAHLISIYPLYLVNIDNPQNKKLIEQSLDAWLRLGNLLQGYSYAGASSAYAAIKEGNQALRFLKLLTDYRITNNTLYCKNEQTIMSPITGTQSILDMIIQSWGGTIRIFPSLPAEWKNIKFYKLRSEGAFTISAERTNGKTNFIEITNEMGELCTVEIDFDNPHFETARKIKITRISDRTYNIPIRKGESVRIYPSGTHPTFTLTPITQSKGNFFGDKN